MTLEQKKLIDKKIKILDCIEKTTSILLEYYLSFKFDNSTSQTYQETKQTIFKLEKQLEDEFEELEKLEKMEF